MEKSGKKKELESLREINAICLDALKNILTHQRVSAGSLVQISATAAIAQKAIEAASAATIANSIEESSAEDSESPEYRGRFCPFCGGTNTRYVADWSSESKDDQENTCNTEEHQCFDCDGASFWI